MMVDSLLKKLGHAHFFKNTWETLGQIAILSLASVCLFYSTVFFFLAPIPLIYGYLRHGRLKSFITILLALFLSNILKPGIFTVVYSLTAPLIALIFSEFCKRKISINQIFLRSILFLFICYSGLLLLVSKGAPYSYLNHHTTSFFRSLPQWIESHPSTFPSFLKLPPSQLMPLKIKLESISQKAEELSKTIIQEHLLSYVINFLLIILWLSMIALKHFGISISSCDLKQWKTPDHLIWLFIAALFFNEVSLPFFSPIGKNFFHIFLVIYFFQGISIAAFYFSHKQYSSIQKVFGYAFLILFPFLTTCCGFFDLWIDFRSHFQKYNKKSILKPKI